MRYKPIFVSFLLLSLFILSPLSLFPQQIKERFYKEESTLPEEDIFGDFKKEIENLKKIIKSLKEVTEKLREEVKKLNNKLDTILHNQEKVRKELHKIKARI